MSLSQRRSYPPLEVEDLRAHRDRLDVRGPERAISTGEAVVPEQSFVRGIGCVLGALILGGCSRHRNPSTTSKTAPAASPRTLFGNPHTAAMEASSSPGGSVTSVVRRVACPPPSVDLSCERTFSIFPASLGASLDPSMIVVGGAIATVQHPDRRVCLTVPVAQRGSRRGRSASSCNRLHGGQSHRQAPGELRIVISAVYARNTQAADTGAPSNARACSG
jgi:hypothetical protein